MFRFLFIFLLTFVQSDLFAMGIPPRDFDSPKSERRSAYLTAPDGVRVHYTVEGEGTAVLLLHGYYGTAEANWYLNGIAQELAKTNKVIAMDIRGHGKSDKPRRARFYGKNMWQDAVRVLDAEGVDQVHLHGFSMGGTLVTQILFHQPERVLSVTYGGSGIPEFDPQEKKNVPADAVPTARMSAEESRAVSRIIALTNPDVLALAVLGQNTPDQGEKRAIDLTQVDVPVLAITGEFDAPNRRTHRLERQLENFRNVIVKDKAHASLITPGFMPKQYLEETVRFIRENDR